MSSTALSKLGLQDIGATPEATMSCSDAFGISPSLSCPRAYSAFRCCPLCDPCGVDGSLCSAAPMALQVAGQQQWISPSCPCDRVVITGACSLRGCAKPDALGVYTRRSGWRTPDGRHIYTRDRVQPSLHTALTAHTAFASPADLAGRPIGVRTSTIFRTTRARMVSVGGRLGQCDDQVRGGAFRRIEAER